MHIDHLRHPRLQIDEFTIRPGESWCVFGSNRSGINEFLSLLEGKLEGAAADTLELPHAPALISFSVQQEIFENEIRNDDSDFLDRPDPGTPARAFLPPGSETEAMIDALDMRHCLDTGYRQLSSGQSRKLLLLQALLGGSKSVVVDSPYDGLDQQVCRQIDEAFSRLPRTRLRLLVLVRNIEDIPAWCSHLALFHKGTLLHSGPRNEIMEKAEKLSEQRARLFEPVLYSRSPKILSQPQPDHELIRLTNGFARYGDNEIFSGLNFSVRQGEHTLITGPNGCGKSTLLHIITGDNSKCYANDLLILGKRRGKGESIWEIKRQMGIVSPEIHRCHRVPGTAAHIVLSGLFDSIGLYQRPTEQQQREALAWLSAIDMEEHARTPFRQLPYCDQRLVLIARALIKRPPLLILDEPTQGLDSTARRALLDFLETISKNGRTTILYVSHRQDEHRSFFRQHLKLDR